jgi:hypothetical protein
VPASPATLPSISPPFHPWWVGNAGEELTGYLSGFRGALQTQANNTAAGVVGMVLFWPALFALDMKGAAGVEMTALESRSAYLATLAAQRHCVA